MAYLDTLDMFNALKDNYNGGGSSYPLAFKYWRNELLKFASNIFTWELEGVESKQIENRLLLCGCCGISKAGSKLIAVEPMLNGLTDYFDTYTRYTWATPLHHSDGLGDIINKTGVLIDNDNLRNGIYNKIHWYSMQLAHTEVTLINVLINGRTGKVYVAGTDKVAQSIRDFRSKLYRGKNDVIVDKSFLGVEVHDEGSTSSLSLKDLLDTRNNILANFYEDIGVQKSMNKKERMVTNEVETNNQLLRLNLYDMFEHRKKGAKDIENVFGVKCTVKCNVDIDDDGQKEGVNGGTI